MDFLRVKNNFNFNFYTRGSVHEIYNSIFNKTNGTTYPNEIQSAKNYPGRDIIVINNIPGYLEARITPNIGPYKLFKVHYLDGFLIDLDGLASLEDYLKFQFESKNRSKLRSVVKRLETCFDIRYKMYYGAITERKFHFLMDTLHAMISRRFIQRGDIHESLDKWDYYKKSAREMILKKKASLFVIYDRDKPIGISLNYHYQNVLFGKIKSFDIDYSKFSPGSISLLKLIEWCLNENHTTFDLSHGNLAYKSSWSTSKYVFEHHVLYHYKKWNIYLAAFAIFQILRLKATLKKKRVDLLYHKIKEKITRGSGQKQKTKDEKIIFEEISLESIDKKSVVPIDINQTEFAYLRKAVYDYQYANSEFSDNIEVYKHHNHHNRYMVQGLKRTVMFTLAENPLSE